jgi:hypothetical protein
MAALATSGVSGVTAPHTGVRGILGNPTLLSLAGFAIAVAWIAIVLPAVAFSAGPVPGRKWLLFLALVVPPAGASALLLTGGLRGIRSRRGMPGRSAKVTSVAFVLAAIAGFLAALYTVLLITNLFGVTRV